MRLISKPIALKSIAIAMLFALFQTATQRGVAAQEQSTKWHGFEQTHMKVGERAAYLVRPEKALPGKPWIWRARFPDFHAEMDIALIGKGFHVAWVDVSNLYGGPPAMAIADEFHALMTGEYKLAPKPVLEGVSRGGLFVYNWAAANPDKITAIYCDTPVLDIRSWPGGKGTGAGSANDWKTCLQVYGLTEETAREFDAIPLNHAEAIASSQIPIMHIVSRNDTAVPPTEHTDLLKQRLESHGHTMQVIEVAEGTPESNGHHFMHPEPQRVVDFILRAVEQSASE